MQLFAKLKKFLRSGFRATLNFRKVKVACSKARNNETAKQPKRNELIFLEYTRYCPNQRPNVVSGFSTGTIPEFSQQTVDSVRGRERPGPSEMNKSVPVCHDVRGQHGRPYIMDVAGVADKTKALYLL